MRKGALWTASDIAIILLLNVFAIESNSRVNFGISCKHETQDLFNEGVAALHSFWYSHAESTFEKVLQIDNSCAIGYWGLSMCRWQQLWSPPSNHTLSMGLDEITKAKSLIQTNSTDKEKAFIYALEQFYTSHTVLSHSERVSRYVNEMSKLYLKHILDAEVSSFYALSILASAAFETSKTKKMMLQQRAGRTLQLSALDYPEHPGVLHYLIHAYDAAPLANLALDASFTYSKSWATIPHAVHMPSHVFTKLGMWKHSWITNMKAYEMSLAYAEDDPYNERFHALEFASYALLQMGQISEAEKLIRIVTSMTPDSHYPYDSILIPARFYLESRQFLEAANMQLLPTQFPWEQYPGAFVILYYTRLVGNAYLGNTREAKTSAVNLFHAYQQFYSQSKDIDEANEMYLLFLLSKVWGHWLEGERDVALLYLKNVTEFEDSIYDINFAPAFLQLSRELLGELLLMSQKPCDALKEFETSLEHAPNRFISLYNAARSARLCSEKDKATLYYLKLLNLCYPEEDYGCKHCPVVHFPATCSQRLEFEEASDYLNAVQIVTVPNLRQQFVYIKLWTFLFVLVSAAIAPAVFLFFALRFYQLSGLRKKSNNNNNNYCNTDNYCANLNLFKSHKSTQTHMD